MSWPNPGVYEGIPAHEYFGLTEINGVLVRSKSMLRDFNSSPRAFKSGFRMKATDAMRKGSLFDCLLTSPERFAQDFILSPYDEFRTNESKEWKAEQKERGLIVVKQAEIEAAKESIERVNSDPRWIEMTKGNPRFQVAMRAEVEGKPFKGLVDLVPDANESAFGNALVDVKRCGTMNDIRDILRTCRKFGYGIQGGLYRGLWKLASGEYRPDFILFIVPDDFSDPSAEICVLNLGKHLLDNGGQEAMRMNRRLIECETSGVWPGAFDGITEVDQADEAWEWSVVEPDLEETGKEDA